MFAVIESGGKQYRVQAGDLVDVELLDGVAPDAAKGSAVRFDRVLVVGGEGDDISFGNPVVSGALVTASLVGVESGPKIRVFKHKRRNTQRKTRGHRQHFHRVRIDEIQLP